jgi:hypothetical protein
MGTRWDDALTRRRLVEEHTVQLDLPRIIEHAADDVAHASRSAADSLGGLVHDLEARAIRRSAPRRSRRNTNILVAVGVVGALLVIVSVIARRRRQATAERTPEATMPSPSAAAPPRDEVYAAKRIA